jgi:galactose mutarotase-like enzyme
MHNIISDKWSLTLNLNGGRIQELYYKGKKVLGTYDRIDGKRGNTHLCVPSFDKEGQVTYGLPFHGLVRNAQWKLKKKSKKSIIISYKTPSSALYPAQLCIKQEFSVKDSFIHKIHVTHIKGKKVPLNISCHYYWDTPKGWKKSILNDSDLPPKIESGGHLGLKKTNLIVFPHVTYQMDVDTFRSAVLWTSFKIDEKGNKLYNNNFCCIEPIIAWPNFFGSNKSILHPGETISASIRIIKVV